VACLDTSFLIDLASRRREFQDRAFKKLAEMAVGPEPLATTRFCVAELYVGIARCEQPEAEERAVKSVLEGLVILDFDDRAARLFAQITAELQIKGRPIGDMDVLIAATAMAAGHYRLVTRDTSHFASIPQLAVEGY